MKLSDEAGWVAKHAWSFRLMLLAAVLSGLEVTIQVMIAFNISTPLPPGFAAAGAGLVTIAAVIARFIAQVHDE